MLGEANMKINPINNIYQQQKSQPNNIVPVNNNLATNPISNKLPAPTGELLQAYSGIKINQAVKKDDSDLQKPEFKQMTAYEYLLTLPNVKQTFKNELAQVANVMEKMDVESSNTEMMVNLVAEGKLWRGVLRYFCANGKMSKNTENDIDMMYNAYAEGKDPIDAYVLTVKNKEDGIKSVKVGDTFEVEGDKNIYFKDDENNARQLKLSKKTFGELFPPAERFAGVQGAAGDCYLLATLNAMIESPTERGKLYDMFEETENSVNVKMPNGEYTYTAPKDDLRQNIDKWQHMQGAAGLVLIEHTYGEELKHKFEKDFHSYMNTEIVRLQKEEPQNTEKIEGYKQRLDDFDEKSKDPEFKPVLMRFENPEANGKLTFKTDENGIVFKDLKSANKEYRRKLSTQADFYRGSIGGDLDTVMRDFGYKKVEEFKPKNPEQEQRLEKLLKSDNTKDYIFTAGALSDGTLVEKTIAKDYSVYGCHAYKIEPFKDKEGNTKFYVENPWNATQNSIMDYEKLKEYFEVICAVNISKENS